ncbi:hypothetical protein [Thauera sp.]|uniref:hypothetical protein n=1 Tax=Thauera sp. TaxID=1905334 RepID=UPI002B6D88D1|nr:hypothetical protein [Thauera sp.]HRP26048.1 hypothetical protein [Thauera sp.]
MDRDQRVKEMKRRIRELAARGLCQAEIARAIGVSRQVIAYHARMARIAVPKEALGVQLG